MHRCFSLLTAAIFLSFLPVSGVAQQDSGIPPMLENKFPMAVPTAKLPSVEQPQVTPAPKAAKSTKTKSAQRKKTKKPKGRLATKKTGKPAAKKKGVSAKPRGKTKANSS